MKLTSLPHDILDIIFKYTIRTVDCQSASHDCRILELVCKPFYAAINSDSLPSNSWVTIVLQRVYCMDIDTRPQSNKFKIAQIEEQQADASKQSTPITNAQEAAAKRQLRAMHQANFIALLQAKISAAETNSTSQTKSNTASSNAQSVRQLVRQFFTKHYLSITQSQALAYYKQLQLEEQEPSIAQRFISLTTVNLAVVGAQAVGKSAFTTMFIQRIFVRICFFAWNDFETSNILCLI